MYPNQGKKTIAERKSFAKKLTNKNKTIGAFLVAVKIVNNQRTRNLFTLMQQEIQF
jgi:hypothetical protein